MKHFALLCLLVAAVSGQTPRELMIQRLRASIGGQSGTVSLFAKNLDTGVTYGIRENERVRTASTIKLPIMAAVFNAVAEHKAQWTDESTLHDAEKVSGTGILREFSEGLRVPLRDLVHLMIVVSDNTATNLVLDHVPADYVNTYLDKIGFKDTRALRKVLAGNSPSGVSEAGRKEENQRFGLGVATPREMVLLLEKIDHGEIVSEGACREMIAILGRQQYKTGIGRRLGAMEVASKSGSLDRLRSDVGLVSSPGGKLAIAITVDDLPATDYSPDNAGEILISELTKLLVEGLAR
jgi:beta-lactamase class A